MITLTALIAKAGGETRVILTESGAQFVTPLSLAALSGHPVRSGLFHPEEETTMGHIELSRWADLVVVAPATAGLIAKAANGLADDLASTTLIATDKRVLLAPAMNVRMWLHPAVQANVERLKAFDGFHGVAVVGPDEGEMACGEYGPGRMAEPAAILEAIEGLMIGAGGRPLTGRKAVVTAGPTFEPIDPARVRMYLCGPTVYDRAHLGNARPVLVFDVLVRLLRHVYGADHVTYVRNFTDVDDKINATALARQQEGAPGSLEDLIRQRTEETIGWYHADMDALWAARPDHEPRATDYIPQMIAMIEALIAKGHAYAAEGHVLFDVRSFPAYGRLSGRSVDDMIAGARVEEDGAEA